MRVSHLGVVAVLAVFAAALPLASAAPAAAAVTLPPGFEDQLVVGGFNTPVAMSVAPDGRLFVAEKAGRVVVVDGGAILPTPFVDLTDEVHAQWDKGLIGMALDPGFAANGFVYLLYMVDPIYGEPDESLESATVGRLTRYTAVGDTADTASRFVLLGSSAADGFANCFLSHAVGALAFGQDGSLFVSGGDGAHFDWVDAGQDSTAYDPECAATFGAAQDIGALRSQTTASLSGKVLRVDPATGLGLSDNPFWDGDPASFASRIWALGLRNPWRFTVGPASAAARRAGGTGPGSLFISDVGMSSFEELNVAEGGENFGWPCFEGNLPHDAYVWDPLTMPACAALPESLVTHPLLPIHDEDPGSLGFIGVVASGVAWYEGGTFPTPYRDVVYLCDFLMGWVKAIEVDSANQLVSIVAFAEGLNTPVDLKVHPDTGDLLYVSYGGGEVRRIRATSATGVDAVAGRPEEGIAEVAPNPLTGETTIAFELAHSEDRVKLTVHDVSGRRVAVLSSGGLGRGRHSVRWGGRDAEGRDVPAGIYFVTLEVAGRRSTEKVAVLK